MEWVKHRRGVYSVRVGADLYVIRDTGARFVRWQATLNGERVATGETLRAAKRWVEERIEREETR